jgi:HSP20 family molecular chaperone IbpA
MRLAHDPFGHAAHQDVGQSAPAMGAEHNQVDAFGMRGVDNLQKRRTHLEQAARFEAGIAQSRRYPIEFPLRQQALLLRDSIHRADVESGAQFAHHHGREGLVNMHHEDFGGEPAGQFLGVFEGVIGVVREVRCGEKLGKCGHEANDTPGATSGQVTGRAGANPCDDRFSTAIPSVHYNCCVASRTPEGGGPHRFGDFARAVDELFEDLLIARWRENRRRTLERPLVNDHGLHYEVKIVTGGADASAIEVEVSDLRLIVRFPGSAEVVENTFNFAQPVECEAVSAKWNSGVLSIVLPKKRGRRVTVE